MKMPMCIFNKKIFVLTVFILFLITPLTTFGFDWSACSSSCGPGEKTRTWEKKVCDGTSDRGGCNGTWKMQTFTETMECMGINCSTDSQTQGLISGSVRFYVVNLDKKEYKPGESIKISAVGFILACANGHYPANLKVSTNGQTKTLFGSDLYGARNYYISQTLTAPDTSGSYKVDISGDVSGSINYTVSTPPPPAPTVTVGWNTTSIEAPNSATFSWDVTPTTDITIKAVCNGPKSINAPAPTSGIHTFNFSTSQTGTESCKITAVNSSGTVEDTATLTIKSSTCTPNGCEANICPTKTCNNGCGIVTGTKNCSPSNPPSNPPSNSGSGGSKPTCSISWSPSTITAPGSSTVTWSSNDATSAKGGCSGVINKPEGTIPANVTDSETLAFTNTGTEKCTITATNSSGTCTQSATLTINDSTTGSPTNNDTDDDDTNGTNGGDGDTNGTNNNTGLTPPCSSNVSCDSKIGGYCGSTYDNCGTLINCGGTSFCQQGLHCPNSICEIQNPGLSLTADPKIVKKGKKSNLKWGIKNYADNCNVTGPDNFYFGTKNDNKDITINQESIYTFTCENWGTTFTETETIKLIPEWDEF